MRSWAACSLCMFLAFHQASLSFSAPNLINQEESSYTCQTYDIQFTRMKDKEVQASKENKSLPPRIEGVSRVSLLRMMTYV
jgi:hypothetical protein